MMKHTVWITTSLLLVLTSCAPNIPSAHYNLTPEGMIDVAREEVTVPLDRPQGLDDLATWLEQSAPSHAILECAQGDALCSSAQRMLNNVGVPAAWRTSNGSNQVMLSYEKLTVRKCDQRSVDRKNRYNNLRHKALGCSVVSNTLNAVSDKRQFINPEKLGYLDGTQAVIIYDDYLHGDPSIESGGDSLLDDVETQ